MLDARDQMEQRARLSIGLVKTAQNSDSSQTKQGDSAQSRASRISNEDAARNLASRLPKGAIIGAEGVTLEDGTTATFLYLADGDDYGLMVRHTGRP